jgi:hypothetical protein
MCYYWFILDFNMSGYEYNSVRFLACLAKGNVSFCHHLSSVVR